MLISNPYLVAYTTSLWLGKLFGI